MPPGWTPKDIQYLTFFLRWRFAERARLLIGHGVVLDTPDTNCDSTCTVGYTPYQMALMRGLPQIAERIKARGGRADPLGGLEQVRAACMAGDRDAAQALAPEHRG